MSEEILIRKEGMTGRITLNRPDALNALTATMVDEIADILPRWRDDPSVQSVIIDGTGDRAFCAGGDVRAFHDAGLENTAFGKSFWRREYALNALIARYPKPYIAIMDGIVMGGGVGVSAHGSHRIVTERSKIAMPETGIGLVPDVGGTYLLAHAPDQLGIYFGLCGTSFGAAGAIQAGFADRFVSSDHIEALIADLCMTQADDVPGVISHKASDPDPPVTDEYRSEIAEAFQYDQVEQCMEALHRINGAWSGKAITALSGRSPLALKLTLAAIRNAAKLQTVEEALNVEYRLTSRLLENGEFLEGVRAAIIDKDRQPKWNPPHLDGVTDAMVAGYFEPLTADEELALSAPDS